MESELDVEKLRNTARLITDSIRNYNKEYKDARCKTHRFITKSITS